jgi:membrane protease YdiL (CAAX protease family)
MVITPRTGRSLYSPRTFAVTADRVPAVSKSNRPSLGRWATRLAAVGAVGLLVWAPLLVLTGPGIVLLLVVMGNQIGFLIIGPPASPSRPAPRAVSGLRALTTGVLAAVAALLLGLLYDMVLRLLFGPGSPTLGPWGGMRQVPPAAAGVIGIMAVVVGPYAEERFFRAGLFRQWSDAGHPWRGAAWSAAVFAGCQLDLWNLPAYLGLGFLLGGVYQLTGSLLAPVTTRCLLNSVLLGLLYSGYQ